MNTKERILQTLEPQRGQYVSGEHLATLLSISRNAVSKAVMDLNAAGFAIDAIPRRGYCLDMQNDRLSPGRIGAYLADKTLTEQVFVHDSLDSTNQKAKELAVAGAGHGTAVLADCQTAGRGRYGRSFTSPPGCGLYLSLVLKPQNLGFGDSPTLVTILAATVVCDALAELCGVNPGIKWVNDVFLQGKKVCGILAEAAADVESGMVSWVVVGIGINIRTKTEDFPEELRHIAGSLYPDGDMTLTRSRIVADIINRFTAGPMYTQDALIARYKQRLFMLNQPVTVASGQESYPALALDVDGEGRLLVRKNDGTEVFVTSGEVRVAPLA